MLFGAPRINATALRPLIEKPISKHDAMNLIIVGVERAFQRGVPRATENTAPIMPPVTTPAEPPARPPIKQ